MSSAKELLRLAEAFDHYCSKCAECRYNATARKGCSYSPSFLPERDADRLTALVANIDLLRDTNTIILHSSAENGYPHTRPKANVCLPAAFVSSSTDTELRETLCHEAMHIHQRKYLDLWKEMCIVEGWTPLSTETIPLRFRERCRLNPDTCYDTPYWAWDNYSVPLPMFKRDMHLTLGDVTIEWFDLRTGALFHDPPESFTRKYGTPSQPEHPFELYAVQFAKEGIHSNLQLLNRIHRILADT
jgi:hypothetical protein